MVLAVVAVVVVLRTLVVIVWDVMRSWWIVVGDPGVRGLPCSDATSSEADCVDAAESVACGGARVWVFVVVVVGF